MEKINAGPRRLVSGAGYLENPLGRYRINMRTRARERYGFIPADSCVSKRGQCEEIRGHSVNSRNVLSGDLKPAGFYQAVYMLKNGS